MCVQGEQGAFASASADLEKDVQERREPGLGGFPWVQVGALRPQLAARGGLPGGGV